MKKGFTLTAIFPLLFPKINKKAFTLAEVLITLGIIGIVASMTLPVLVEKHQKRVVVTRLQKFYTNINQAIRLSEADNGPAEYWEYPAVDNDYETTKAFYDKYLAKYLKSYDVQPYQEAYKNDDGSDSEGGETNNWAFVKFSDGSGMLLGASVGMDITFFPRAAKNSKATNDSRNVFKFSFNKIDSVGHKTVVEPYSYLWDGTREHLVSNTRYGCSKGGLKNYCAKLIQIDGWQIKDDYPW